MVKIRAGYELQSLGYRPETDAHLFGYDSDETPPSMALVSALSTVLDVDPNAIDPIQRAVDVEALDTLLTERDDALEAVAVTLRHAGRVVTIDSNGGVRIESTETGRVDVDSIDDHR